MAFGSSRDVNYASSNTNFNYPAYGIEKVLTQKAGQLWTRVHPILGLIQGNKVNFMKNGFDQGTTGILIPIVGADKTTAADGITDGSNEITGRTVSITNGPTHFSFPYSHYTDSVLVLESEKRLAMGGKRMNFWDSKITQSLESFKNAISNDMAGSTAAARDNVEGLQNTCDDGAIVGNVDLSDSANASLRPYNNDTGGPFSLDLIDDAYDAIIEKGRAEPDLCILSRYSTTSGPNIYGKLRSAIAPAERYENTDFKVKYGITAIVYSGMACVPDQRLATSVGTSVGQIQVLSSSAWGIDGMMKPELIDGCPTPFMPGSTKYTDALLYVYTWWLSLWCRDTTTNALVKNVT